MSKAWRCVRLISAMTSSNKPASVFRNRGKPRAALIVNMFFKRKKKQPAKPIESEKLNAAEPSFIGQNCRFEGNIICDGELHIDGTVRGTVQANMCVIDKHGNLEGSISAAIIHVRGRVMGPLQGGNIFIHAEAHVEGDVFNDTISIENGAYVYGSIRHNSSPASPGSVIKAGGLIEGYSNVSVLSKQTAEFKSLAQKMKG
jgi:cytoskeletal protein CcmA (bactofilin family)